MKILKIQSVIETYLLCALTATPLYLVGVGSQCV